MVFVRRDPPVAAGAERLVEPRELRPEPIVVGTPPGPGSSSRPSLTTWPSRSHGSPFVNSATNTSTRSGSNCDARLTPELVERGLVADRRPVGPPRDHRLVGVDDRHDPGPDRDVTPGQPVGIAAAVVPLVVVEHDGGRVPQRARLLEHDLADLGMLGHDAPLGVARSPGRARMSSGIASLPRSWSRLAVRIRSSSPLGRSDGPPERHGGLGDHRRRLAGPGRSRPASAVIRASWAASIAARPDVEGPRPGLGAIGARRTVPSSPVSRKT